MSYRIFIKNQKFYLKNHYRLEFPSSSNVKVASQELSKEEKTRSLPKVCPRYWISALWDSPYEALTQHLHAPPSVSQAVR